MKTITKAIIFFLTLSTTVYANGYQCEVTSIENLTTHTASKPTNKISYKAEMKSGNLYVTTDSGDVTEYKTAMILEGVTVMIDKDMSSTALVKDTLKNGLSIDYEEVKYIFTCK